MRYAILTLSLLFAACAADLQTSSTEQSICTQIVCDGWGLNCWEEEIGCGPGQGGGGGGSGQTGCYGYCNLGAGQGNADTFCMDKCNDFSSNVICKPVSLNSLDGYCWTL